MRSSNYTRTSHLMALFAERYTSRETLEAMKETRRILAHPENYKGMTVDEALKALDV